MTNEQIISYLKDEARRPLLNFHRIEINYGLDRGRIYTVLFAKDAGNSFRPDEIIGLSKAIADLQYSVIE